MGTNAKAITLVAAGDVEWTGNVTTVPATHVSYDDHGVGLLQGGWQPVPRLLTPDKMKLLAERDDPFLKQFLAGLEAEFGATLQQAHELYKRQAYYHFNYQTDLEWARHPFEKIASVFQEADIAFVNLETPLSDDAYMIGQLRTRTKFTDGLNFAGIDIVSIANNHMLDAERQGLFDTINALDAAGIKHVGAGKDLDAATAPQIFEVDGIRVAFLAYTQYENSGVRAFATSTRAGVAPLDPDRIKADIALVRKKVDHVILSFHWDIFHFDVSRQQDLHPKAVEFAHDIIDAGADVILGHHPHVPRALEVYKGKPIFYSLSHLIFSFNLPNWRDNYVARLSLTKNSVIRVEVIPVAGVGDELGQPYPLIGERATLMLENLIALSKERGTEMRQVGDLGVIDIASE